MKKILFSILLFIPVLAFAQNTVTVPGGSLPIIAQAWRVTGTPTDSINKRYFMTFSGGSWNEIYTATYVSKNFIRKGSEDSVVFSNQFKKSSGVVIINTDTIGVGRQYHISIDSATGNMRLDTSNFHRYYAGIGLKLSNTQFRIDTTKVAPRQFVFVNQTLHTLTLYTYTDNTQTHIKTKQDVAPGQVAFSYASSPLNDANMVNNGSGFHDDLYYSVDGGATYNTFVLNNNQFTGSSVHVGLSNFLLVTEVSVSPVLPVDYTPPYITASSTNTLTNKSGNISQWTNDIGYSILPSLSNHSVIFSNGTNLTQDNNNFYYDATTHRLSVGTGGDFGTTSSVGIYGPYDSYVPNSAISTINSRPGIITRSSRGTGTSPTINNTLDYVGSFTGEAYTGSIPAYTTVAGISYRAVGTTGSNLGGQIDIYVKANNSGALQTALTILNTGVVKFPLTAIAGGLFYGDATGTLLQSNAITGLIKGNGTSAPTAATLGTDYINPTNFIFNETPSGTINGINSSFGLANTPQTGKVMVFKNGQLLNPTTDYTISGTTISMIIPPVTGSYLNVAYLK